MTARRRLGMTRIVLQKFGGKHFLLRSFLEAPSAVWRWRRSLSFIRCAEIRGRRNAKSKTPIGMVSAVFKTCLSTKSFGPDSGNFLAGKKLGGIKNA
jgi:hypothetical protein